MARYVYDNTAKKLRPAELESVRPKKKVSNNVRRNRERAGHMNPAYILFLTMAMAVTGYFCLQYLQIQADITNDIKKVAVLESRLNTLRAENDDTENRIKGSVDLEDIKKRAMNDLGMQYASESQIIRYESDDTDYVRQYVSIE